MSQPCHPLDVPLEFSDEDYDPDDPDQELLYEADGTPLDAKRLAELEREAEEGAYTRGETIFVRPPGRPSLSESGTSPTVHFRVPNELRERAEQAAKSEGVTISEFARRLLERELADHER